MDRHPDALGNRSWQRQNCGTEGSFTANELETRTFMVDASCGGFKLRFENVEASMAALLPLPKDVLVTNIDGLVFAATVLWAKNGLAGCRFYQHLDLDQVVSLMTGRFTLKLAKA